MNLLQMGISGSIFILIVLAVRGLFFRRLPKTTFFVLWGIAALRLLLPFSVKLPFSLLPGIHVVSAAGSPVSAPVPAGQPAETLPIFSMLWALGTLVLTLWFVLSYRQSMEKFRTSLPDTSPAVTDWIAARTGRHPEVRVSDRITSPLTYGLFRPVILLPKKMDRRDETALTAVLTHEYVHVRRMDNLTKLVFAAALCLHWWNPLAWTMYILGSRDMELSCDAAVLRTLGAQHRSTYALTLISMEERRSGYADLQSCFSKNAITERIEAIMNFKKSSAAAIAAAVVLTISGAAAAFAAEKDTTAADMPAIKSSEILAIENKDGTPSQAPGTHGDISFAPELEPDSGCRILPKSETPDAELPPLDIPDDFREAVQKGEISPLTPQDGVTVSVFDADGNQVTLAVDTYNTDTGSDADAPYLYLAPVLEQQTFSGDPA